MKNCNLSYSKDATRIKGLRFKAGERRGEILKLRPLERIDLQYPFGIWTQVSGIRSIFLQQRRRFAFTTVETITGFCSAGPDERGGFV